MATQEESTQERTGRNQRGRWLAVAAGALVACIAGLLGARLVSSTYFRPRDADRLHEVAGLPLPKVAPDLHPQYRDLVEQLRQVASRLVESFPTDVRSVAALALLHNLAHDDAGEVACWQRCLELDRGYLMAYAALASRATNKGEYQQAEELLRQAIQVPGASSAFADLLASVLTDQGKFQEAARVMENSLASEPPTARTHVRLGEVYVRLKEFQKAKAQFLTAIQIDPSSTRAYHGLAQAWARLGSAQEAEKCRAEVARLKRLEEEAGRKQRDEGAPRHVDQRAAPQYAAQILTMAASVYWSHQQADAAEQHLRRAAELSPGDAPCRTALADLYSAQGRLVEAQAFVEELRKLEPGNLTHLRNLGILQGRLRRWEAAQKTFRELCELAPDRAAGYVGLAESYLRMGQELARARELAARAAGLEPSAWNYFILAAICEKQGDLDAARSALKKAIALDPNNSRYRQLYASMKAKQ